MPSWLLYAHTPDQGGEGSCPKEDAFEECRAGYPTNKRRTSFCRLCCKPTSKGQLAPFLVVRHTQPKRRLLSRKSQWHCCCRLSGSRTASEVYQWQFDIGRGESRFQWNPHSQNGSDNVIIHFCRMCLLKHKITCCQWDCRHSSSEDIGDNCMTCNEWCLDWRFFSQPTVKRVLLSSVGTSSLPCSHFSQGFPSVCCFHPCPVRALIRPSCDLTLIPQQASFEAGGTKRGLWRQRGPWKHQLQPKDPFQVWQRAVDHCHLRTRFCGSRRTHYASNFQLQNQ